MPSPKKNKPQDHKPSSKPFGSSWRTQLHDLDLPSGERCQVKRPGVQGLMKAGVLHSLDSLTAIVQSETIPKSEGKPVPKGQDIKSIVEDPEKFDKMMNAVDKIVVHVVVQPEVFAATRPVLDADDQPVLKDGEPVVEDIPESERDPELIYVDYIDAIDKMFIMNFAVGGSADLQEFRKATEASVGSVSAGEAAEDATE